LLAGAIVFLQWYAALSEDIVSWWRPLAIVLATMLLVWAVLPARWLVVNIVASFAIAILATFTLLEQCVLQGHFPLARGVLGLAFLVTVIAFVLQYVSNPSHVARSRVARISLKTMLSLLVIALVSWMVEGMVGMLRPANTYHIVPDRADVALSMYRQIPDRGIAVLEPGFEGHYIHPEFYGLKVAVNTLGFRDGMDEAAPLNAKHSHGISILILGDSFAFGTGVELSDVFHERLEDQGLGITDGPLRIYGAGVPGYGQYEALALYEMLADKLQPRIVVNALYEGNDLLNNLVARQNRVGPWASAGLCARIAVTPFDRYCKQLFHAPFWLGSSAAVQLLGPKVRVVGTRLGIMPPLPAMSRFPGVILEEPPCDEVERGMASTLDALERLAASCQKRGASLVVLVIPTSLQADPDRFDAFVMQSTAPPRRLDRTKFHTHLVRRLCEAGYFVVDPLDVLESSARAGKPCYHGEGHFNAHGHALAADALVPALRTLLSGTR
jgi:hypothetical protein